ncbi:hypothetical protein D9615_006852 [Tricholomella constricta]|uniref:Uncharacterized protein n=1 Tax=Tricholomella constricta TaxID=117010 RepID=A0A8H5H919_9AGAR|nr:hypothetical protein D9615_006852 [Tricholomella constricta]
MHSFSILYLILFAASVNAAVFNLLHPWEVPSLATKYGLEYLNESFTEENLSNRARLQRKHSRWFPTPVSNRPGPRQVSNSSLTPSATAANLINARPTPEPTGDPSPSTTVHITDIADFSLILPNTPGELISDAEADGVSFCSPNSASPDCVNNFPEGFITAAAFEASDDGAYIQITGCIDPAKFHLDPSDAGGQFDVRYPNGAQCTFGGYGASFIELQVHCFRVFEHNLTTYSFVNPELNPEPSGFVSVAVLQQAIRSTATRIKTEWGARMRFQACTTSPTLGYFVVRSLSVFPDWTLIVMSFRVCYPSLLFLLLVYTNLSVYPVHPNPVSS